MFSGRSTSRFGPGHCFSVFKGPVETSKFSKSIKPIRNLFVGLIPSYRLKGGLDVWKTPNEEE